MHTYAWGDGQIAMELQGGGATQQINIVKPFPVPVGFIYFGNILAQYYLKISYNSNWLMSHSGFFVIGMFDMNIPLNTHQ